MTAIALQGQIAIILSPPITPNKVPPPLTNTDATHTATSKSAEELIQTATAFQSEVETLRPSWDLGRLIYTKNFEDKFASGLKNVSGSFEIPPAGNGNYEWRTNNYSASLIKLASFYRAYPVEFKIMQVSGDRGLGGIFFSNVEDGYPGFEVYLNQTSSKVTLIEKRVCVMKLKLTY